MIQVTRVLTILFTIIGCSAPPENLPCRPECDDYYIEWLSLEGKSNHELLKYDQLHACRDTLLFISDVSELLVILDMRGIGTANQITFMYDYNGSFIIAEYKNGRALATLIPI